MHIIIILHFCHRSIVIRLSNWAETLVSSKTAGRVLIPVDMQLWYPSYSSLQTRHCLIIQPRDTGLLTSEELERGSAAFFWKGASVHLIFETGFTSLSVPARNAYLAAADGAAIRLVLTCAGQFGEFLHTTIWFDIRSPPRGNVGLLINADNNKSPAAEYVISGAMSRYKK